MKKIYISILVVILLVMQVWAITPSTYHRKYDDRSAKELLGGEHDPIIYSGSVDISNTNSLVGYTYWMATSVDYGLNTEEQQVILDHNPEYFTLFITLETDGDSASLTDAWFEIAKTYSDTTDTVTIACDEADTSEVGDYITGDVSGAIADIISITQGTATGDSVIVATMRNGNLWDASTADSISVNGEAVSMVISGASYSHAMIAVLNDSSHVFIESGNYSHDLYNTWLAEVESRTANSIIYFLRIPCGAWMRMYFGDTTVADVTTVNWVLIEEH